MVQQSSRCGLVPPVGCLGLVQSLQTCEHRLSCAAFTCQRMACNLLAAGYPVATWDLQMHLPCESLLLTCGPLTAIEASAAMGAAVLSMTQVLVQEEILRRVAVLMMLRSFAF